MKIFTRKWTAVLLILALTALTACGTKNPQNTTTDTDPTTQTQTTAPTTAVREETAEVPDTSDSFETTEAPVSGDFSITMLDVGQGLALYLEADGERMLYDGGGRDRSRQIISRLESLGCTSLTLLAASHYDEDHIAGIVAALRNYPVEMILCPDYRGDTNIYQSFEAALREVETTVVHPKVGDTFELGQAKITVIGPEKYDAAKDNNNSIALLVQYGAFRCLITSDAEAEEEAEILAAVKDLRVDLYVVGHHGSRYSTTEALLKAMKPTAAWISCGRGNDYGHPAQETMDILERYNVDIYRTDIQGEVTCTTDGSEITYSLEPCEDHSAGMVEEDLASGIFDADTGDGSTNDRNMTSEAMDYILNEHTKKFHKPGCYAASKMSDKNRKEVTATREELLAAGYDPCGSCNP